MQNNVSKKRRNLVLFILLALVAALGIFVFAACSDDINEDTIKKRGYKVAVTYDFQGGTVNNKGSVRLLVKENSKLPAPSKSGGGVGIPAKAGYSFKGFYLAEMDENGNVKHDDDGNIIVSDTEWVFSADTVADKDVTLCAKWWNNYKVVLHYGKDYAKSTNIDLPRTVDGKATSLYESAFRVKDYTFLSYNFVQDSTEEATALSKFPYDFSTVAGDSLTIDVWGQSLDGNYQLVREAKDLSISSVGEEANFYLLNDIDMKDAVYDDEKSSTKIPKSYKGKFIGNGHTISNFTMKMKALDRTYENFGMFRMLESGAEITDVTFKDVKLSYEVSNTDITQYHVGIIAGQCAAGAVVKNVNITSTSSDSCTFEYLIGVGVDKNALDIADDLLVAQKNASAVLENCSATNVKVFKSTAVITADQEYTLYVKYTDDNGSILFDKDAIYKLSQKNRNGGYSAKTISSTEYVEENKYVLTRIDKSVYDVTLSVDNDVISATMIKR
ncbi:MAG: InlB B-repeat-containing protein [Clostridiales bacterium]|nr:InlB B-repeat-containing protein [Clostridiales bacterium]